MMQSYWMQAGEQGVSLQRHGTGEMKNDAA